MRNKHTVQRSIFNLYCDHEIGLELKAMSVFLDRHLEILDWVSTDLQVKGFHGPGRSVLPIECVIRCALLKQSRQLSYKELSFHLCDSASFQAFARLPMGWYPKKSALQDTISKINPQTWERINHCLLDEAQSTKIEKARTIRIDSTATESDIHEPTDSSLLEDSVRIMLRLLKVTRKLPGNLTIDFVNHNRRAKRRAHDIFNTKGIAEKVPLYADLIKITSNSLLSLAQAEIAVCDSCTDVLRKESGRARSIDLHLLFNG